MVPLDETGVPRINLRALLQEAVVLMDQRYGELRKGTPYEKSRPSDIRVFVAAARQPGTETDIANRLQVSRQAIQSSVKRLVAAGVVSLKPHNNKRDKLITLTPVGCAISQTAAQHLATVEDEIQGGLGEEKMRELYDALAKVVHVLQQAIPKK